MALRSIQVADLPERTREDIWSQAAADDSRTGIRGTHYACGCVEGKTYFYLCLYHAGHAAALALPFIAGADNGN